MVLPNPNNNPVFRFRDFNSPPFEATQHIGPVYAQISPRGRGRGRGTGRGRNKNYTGRGRSTPFYGPGNYSTPRNNNHWNNPPPWGQYQHWTYPPCPHPTQPHGPTTQPPSPAPGILGSRPSQAYAASESAYTPTDLEQAFHTMTMHPPDQNWYMDTGATSHMTNSTGNFTSYFNKSLFRNIIVGNGSTIPIQGTGHHTLTHPYPPLILRDILHVPNIIKNLISVRKLTTDNSITIEFDPFGFNVKDLKTRIPILRCNSTGDLYPLTFNSPSQLTPPSAFAAITQDMWHHRLGHPGASILNLLKPSLSFDSVSKPLNSVCSSCVFGKQIKLPFFPSYSCTYLPFDIVHSDLWTSPVLSSAGHHLTPHSAYLDAFATHCFPLLPSTNFKIAQLHVFS
ncbi:hypothetical protein E3N88_06293 [Mikania micrantha]|uniref:Uncharacterized protein n=1 Tax=Mikania micrantha TaxID=192012 RepID=A0A5N6PQF9_9ASTR|nr:hypothetical protein E3N88_06293 [Mikania micrantha]